MRKKINNKKRKRKIESKTGRKDRKKIPENDRKMDLEAKNGPKVQKEKIKAIIKIKQRLHIKLLILVV